MARINSGQLLENAVYNQLKQRGRINYFKKKTGAEVDFVLNKKIAYEVKSTASLVDIGALRRSMDHAKLKSGYVVSQNYVATDTDAIAFGEFL